MIYVQTVMAVLLLMAIFAVVRNVARRFATLHPEFGPLKEEGEGCGCGNKRCGEAECKREKHH